MASRSSSLTRSLADGTDAGLRRFLLNFFRFILVVLCGCALELDHFHLQRCLGLPRRDIDQEKMMKSSFVRTKAFDQRRSQPSGQPHLDAVLVIRSEHVAVAYEHHGDLVFLEERESGV